MEQIIQVKHFKCGYFHLTKIGFQIPVFLEFQHAQDLILSSPTILVFTKINNCCKHLSGKYGLQKREVLRQSEVTRTKKLKI